MKRAITLAASALAGLLTIPLGVPVYAESYAVKMKFNIDTGDHYFEPAKLEIHPGDTVEWIQDDASNEHNVAAYPDRIPADTEPFLSPLLTSPGETWSHTFAKAGSYFYHCHPHEDTGMRGLIIVGRQTPTEELRQPKRGEMLHDLGSGNKPTSDGAKLKGDHMMTDGSMMKDLDMTEGEVMKESEMMKPREDNLHVPPDDDGYYGEDHHFD